MLDAYKELTPVVYGKNPIKHLYHEATAERMCFNMHWHNRMELNWVISGTLLLHSEGRHFQVQPGQVVISTPGKMHGGIAGSEGVRYHTFMFDVEKFCNLTAASDKYLVPVLKGEVAFTPVIDDEDVRRTLERLLDIMMKDADYHPLQAQAVIYDLIGMFYKHGIVGVKTAIDSDKGFNRIIEYVNTHFVEKLSPREISVQYGYNESYFCRRFKEVTGFTFTRYVQALRMEYAVALLTEGKEEIRYIAWKCGYSDASYFSDCFKRHFGFRPSKIYGGEL